MHTPYDARYFARRKALLNERAVGMRGNATASEQRLWRCLVNSKLGVPFRRQYVIRGRIADFAAPSIRLIVEVDGCSHSGRSRADARRDAELARAGYRVLRVSAAAVMRELDAVVARIVVELAR